MKIVPITLRAANDFVERHHRHSARTANDGGKFAIGLEKDGEMVGVAIVGRPVARLLSAPGTAEILRLCVSPAAPRNACSRLYGRCKRIWQLMGGDRIVTYTLASEPGGSLRAAGLALEAATPAHSWSSARRPREARQSEQHAKARYGAVLPEVPA